MINFDEFESLEKEKPFFLLDQHPDGKHLEMHVEIGDVYLAAVWNIDTKRLAWFPEDAHALAWLHQGTQIAALQNPILSEDFLFATYSWPQGQLLQQCPLRFPMGYLFDLVLSPANDFAVCQWTEQCEFGFEFITLSDHNVLHLPQHGYIKRGTNLTTRPIFRPDGRFWVCVYQDNPDWWLDEDVFHHSGKFVAKEGERVQFGTLLVFQQTQLVGEIPLTITIPSGYCPSSAITSGFFPGETFSADYSGGELASLFDLAFLDEDRIMISLLSGEVQVYDLSTL